MSETYKYTKDETRVFAERLIIEKYGKRPFNVRYIGGGSFGMVYLCIMPQTYERFIIKAFLLEGMHQKEAFDLNALRKACPLKVPQVYHVHSKTDNIPVDMIIMEYITGHDAFTSPFLLLKPKKKKQHFADELTDAMIKIHETKSDKFGDIRNPKYNTWLEYYRPIAEDIYKKAEELNKEGSLPKSVYSTMQKAWQHFDEIFFEKVKEAVLLHGDLNVMNVMVNKKTFEITAIIDPLKSVYGDREYDLFQLNNLTGKKYGLYDLYKKKYPVSKNCDIKCAFYGLFNEVNVYFETGSYFAPLMNSVVKEMNRQLFDKYTAE